MKNLKRIFSYAKDYKGKIVKSVVFAILSVIMGIVPYFLVHRIVLKFIGEMPVTMSYVAVMALGVTISLSLKGVLFAKSTIYSHESAYDILMEMRTKLAEKMVKMPMGEIQRRTAGNFKNIFVDDIESMEIILAHMIPEIIANGLVPAIIIIYILVLDWRMALLSLGTIPIGYFFYNLLMKDSKIKLKNFFKATDEMNGTIIEYIKGMEVIKTFNQTTSSFGKYTNSVNNYRDFALDWHKYSWPYMAAYAVVLPCTLAFVVPFGALFYIRGTLSLSTYFLCILLSLGFTTPIIKLSEHIDNLEVIGEKEKKINKILDGEELEETREDVLLDNYSVTLKDVTFAYGKKEVLKNISFVAKENTVTALVGRSGSGKSTIAKLISRFWDVGRGEVKIGDVNIKDLTLEGLMNVISYVSQDIYLFNTSIMENIRMGRPDASDEDVIRVAKLAQCHEFIMETENGYDTKVGDEGDKLSGGQRQRISIARALLKDAPIVILDEATTFTDPENEDKIQEAINNLTGNKTLIAIAHRLSTIVDADNIILLDNGRILAQGTQEELLDGSRLYRKMWEAHSGTMEWNMSVKGVDI